VSLAAWPAYDPALTVDDEHEVVAQVNGKIRARLTVAAGTAAATLEQLARTNERIAELIDGKTDRQGDRRSG